MMYSKTFYQSRLFPLFAVSLLCVLFLYPYSLAAAQENLESEKEQISSEEQIASSKILLTGVPVSGPGNFLDTLLHSLNKQSDESEGALKKLRAEIPQVLPDLYKVYLTL